MPARQMLTTSVIRTGVLGAVLTLLTSGIPRTAHLVHSESEGCGKGCDFVAGGWPFIYIVDGFGFSPTGSVDLIDATLTGGDLLWWDGLLLSLVFWVGVVAVGAFAVRRFLGRHRSGAVSGALPISARNETSGLPRTASQAAGRRTVWGVTAAYVLLSPAAASVAFLLGMWLFFPGGRVSPEAVLGVVIGCYPFGALPSAVAGWVHHAAGPAERGPFKVGGVSVAAGACATALEMATWASGLVELSRMGLVMLSAVAGLLVVAIWLLRGGASPWD